MVGQDEWPSESRFIPTETEVEEWPSETRYLSNYIQQKSIDWKWIALGIGLTILTVHLMRKR